MRVSDPVEVLYLTLMHRWQKTAPPDKHLGMLDGEPARNTQVSRLAYVLDKIAAGVVDRTFSKLEGLTIRKDGTSLISRHQHRMQEPFPLLDGWYLEGCLSLEAKRECIIRNLRHLALSASFINAVDSFVTGGDIENYFPTDERSKQSLS